MTTGGRVGEVELLSAEQRHEGVEDDELARSEGTDHHTASWETHSGEVDETDLTGEATKADHDGALATGAGLVDLGKKGIGRVGDDGSGDTSNHTRGDGDTSLGSGGEGAAVREGTVDCLSGSTLDSELGHGVRDLFAEDWGETTVKTVKQTVLGEDMAEGARHGHGGERLVGDLTDAGGLKRAEENVGDELGNSRGTKVDVVAVVPGSLVTKGLGEGDLEVLEASELEPTWRERG